jgi:drug/metabolite transporter (DMT)-like permease
MNIKHFLKIKDHYEVVKEKKVPLVLFSIVSVVFAYLIGNIAYLFALSVNNDATMLVPLIAYVMPIIIMTIISYFVTKDNINMRMMIGIAITIFGIVFTLLNKDK